MYVYIYVYNILEEYSEVTTLPPYTLSRDGGSLSDVRQYPKQRTPDAFSRRSNNNLHDEIEKMQTRYILLQLRELHHRFPDTLSSSLSPLINPC